MDKEWKFSIKDGKEIAMRPAEAADSEGIIKTLKSFSPERSYVLMEQYGKGVESEKDYITAMDTKNNLLLVAMFDSTVIGILEALQSDGGYRPETSHILGIGLHIKGEFRGFGIGLKMLQYAEEWAREQGFKKLEASVFTTNKRSLTLFRKAGFSQECTKVKRIRVGNEFIDEVCIGKWLE
ncbi:MAG: GNAT family N-acetyltransferase [Nitrospirae bacterium]|nr:GNAT family N-acetyltransferase [Nitrospirota bacterium]